MPGDWVRAGRVVRAALGLCATLALARAAPARAQTHDSARLLRLGVMVEEPTEPDRVLRVYSDLIGVLRRSLAPRGIVVPDIVIARDLDDLSRRLVSGQVDFVIETVFPSLLLQERSRRLEPGLVVIRRGQREYRSVFFTGRDSPIRKLADLADRTLVLQALRSTSAFALPRAELARHGIALVPAGAPARGAVRYVLAGAELNEAIWVLHGRADAGAFNGGDWRALPARVRDGLRIFHESRPILRALLSFRTGLDKDVRAALVELLLSLPANPEGRAALARASGITGFERLSTQDRDALRAWEPVLSPPGSAP